MKQSELVKLMKAAGCTIVKHGARHDMWYSPITGCKTFIPRHPSQEIAKGTEMQIRKALGI